MDVFKATPYQKRIDEKQDKSVFKGTKYRSYDPNTVKQWKDSNGQSLGILNDYGERIKKGEWLSEEDRASYRSALDSYIETTNRLRGVDRTFGYEYSAEDEKKWADSITSMNREYEDMAGVFSQFSNQNEYSHWNETNSKMQEYADSALSAEDFSEYAQKGTEVTNPDWNKAHAPFEIFGWAPFGDGEDIGNMVTFAEANAAKGVNSSAQSAISGGTSKFGEIINLINTHMTDEEKNIYNYYVGKGDTQKANEYLTYITDILRQRQGGQIADQINNTGWEAAMSAIAGIDSWVSGMENIDNYILGKEGDPTNALQYAQGEMGKDNSGIWGITNDLLYTTGNMTPSILVSMIPVIGKVAGKVSFGASAIGNAYSEMKKLGYSEGQSRGYATLVGASEVVLESLMGGISKLGGSKSLSAAIENFVGKFDHALARLAISVPLKMGSEALEESLQTVLEPAFKALLTGEKFESPEWEEILYSALLGALSAGTLEGIPGTINAVGSIKTANDYKSMYGSNASDLVTEALAIDPKNEHAKSMQKKLDQEKALSGYNIARLLSDTENAYISRDKAKIKSAVEKRLTELGESGNNGDISRIAEAIAKTQAGEKLTRSEKSLIKKSKYGLNVLSELDPEVIASGESTSDWNGNIGTDRIGTDIYNRNIPVESTTGTEQTKSVSAEDNGPIKENSSTSEIQAHSGMETATQSDETQKADTEYADETELSDEAEKSTAGLEKAASEYGAQAKAFIHTYKKGQDIQQYDQAYRMAYNMGKSGVSLSYTMQSKSTAYLTEQQRELAYEAGQAEAGTSAKEQHDKIKATANGKTGRKKGTVKGDGVTIADLKSAFNDTQNTAYKILCMIAEATGIDIVLYKSEANADGKFTEAQGKFNRTDDNIHIDINAGLKNKADVEDLAQYTMLRTFSHEFTHFLEKYNPEWYNEFRKTVFETLTERGEDVNDLIELKQEQNPGMDYDRASREVVAEAMTDILPDSHFIETLVTRHKNIFEKLYDKLKEFIADIKAHFKKLDGGLPREAKALKEQIGEAVRYAESIVKMFDEGALAAVDNYQMTVAFDGEIETVEERSVINEVVTDTEEVIPDTHSEEEQTPVEEKTETLPEKQTTVETPAKVEEPVKVGKKPSPVEATDGLVIKQKETVSKQGEPSIEEREKAFKRKFAFLKKAGRVCVLQHGNVSFLTDLSLAIRATEDECNFAHIEYSGIIEERNTKGMPLEKVIDNANKQLTEAPIQGVSGGMDVYVFNIDGKHVVFNKKLLSKLDGNILYIGDHTKGTYVLKAVDLDGNVAGFLLNMKIKGEVTDAEPSKLKSFSSKFLAQVSKKESTETKTEAPAVAPVGDVGDVGERGQEAQRDDVLTSYNEAKAYAEEKGYKIELNKLSAKKNIIQVDIHDKQGLPTIDPVIIGELGKDNDKTKWNKVKEAIDRREAADNSAADTNDGGKLHDEVVEQSKTPSEKLADILLEKYLNIENLSRNSEPSKVLTSKMLYEIADEAFGGTQAEGKYDRKDAYDAMELAVNKFLLKYAAAKSRFLNFNGNTAQAVSAVKKLEHLLSVLPTQSVRTQEMEEFQQFSTPPNIAYLAAWAANISANDFVLEPSAGIGGLAVFAKAWGAEVAVNELSKRRLEVLRSMGFDHLFNENAEHIDNILPENISPSVVIMNPPFSSTAGRLKNNKTSNAEMHIDQALARLRDGGRLVAILGQGMNNADYYKYWDKLRKSFNIRANLSIDGSNYRKYGTTYGVQIVVIDKTGPQVGETVTGTFTDLTEIPKVLEGIRNDRSNLETNRPASADNSIRESVSDGRNEHADTGHQRIDERADGSPSGNERSENRKGSDGNEGAGNRTDVKRPEKSGSKKTERKDGGTDRDSGRTDSGDGVGATESSISDRHQSELPLPRLNDTVETEEVSDDGVYATFVSPEIPVKGGKKHPAVLVESAAMAAVSMPKATYKVHLPADVIANNLSEAQLVTVTYAGQAHEQMLPDKRRKGFFIGDGTGVGKGRQIAGIILDNFMQGRKKAVWISKNNDLFGDAVRDWTATTGRGKEEVFSHSKIKSGGKITNTEGILFSTYDTLKSEKGGNRLEQIVEWLGKDFDGVIAFDEAHAMGNLFGRKSKFGKSKGSLVAQAGVELQRRLPNARIVYVSATAATEVDNLAYAERIGLWGPGTAFNNAQDFISKIGSSGLAAMELVIRDMKAMGSYVARSISYNGVNYDTVEHALDPMQTEIYNTMSRAWQKTMSDVQNALETTGGKYNSTARQKALGNFYSSMQRFYNQVLTSMSMPSVIADMKKELADGHSCVLQIVNTNEAQQNKKLAEAKANGDSLDDLDLTPRESLIGYLMNSFPTQMYEEYTDDDGNLKSRPVLDSKGNPVQNKEAIKQRDSLIAEVNQMSIPDGPLEMLFDVFGTEMVAENTGRSRRVVPKKMSDGSVSRVEERRTLNHRTADVQAFQDGKKRVLVFSDAGGTGKSYHADRTEKNQQLRIHYVLQPGWVASNAVQGFGRTHRSNEASAPVYKLVTTNIKGQKRFTSTIARRLDQLGALTKGQRDTGSGMFGAKDNLETDLAMDSLREFYRRLGKNKIEGIDGMKTLERLGLKEKFSDEYGAFKLDEKTARDIGTFLNRILALEVDEQNTIFDSFISIYEMELEAAIQAGTLDTGMENVKADKIEVIDDKVIRGGNNTSEDTHYIQAKTYKKPKIVTDVDSMSKMRNGFIGIYKTKNGAVRAVYRIADKTTEWGAVQKQYRLVGPNQGASTRTWSEAELAAKATEVDKAEWQKEWDAEVAKVPKYNEDTIHMLTGALLPIWNSLPQEGSTKVKRLITDKGDAYLGRVINKDMIDTVLGRFDINRTMEVYSAKKVMEKALQKGVHFYLTNSRAEIFRSRVSNEWRLEITQPYNTWYLKRTYPEVIQERISYRDRFFIPVGENGEAVLERILADNPVRNASDEDVQEQSREYLEDEDVQEQQHAETVSDRTFSYDELVAKKDLAGTVITKDQTVKLTDEGTVDLNELIENAKKHCSVIHTKSSEPTYYVKVADIDENVEITRNGIIHGIARKNKLNPGGTLPNSVLVNARATLDIANILANSIEVNRSSRDGNIDVPYTHVMLGVTAMENSDGIVEYYAVRSMVQERINQNPILVESNILGKLYALNAKKIDTSYDRGTIRDSVALTTKHQFDYSIADLLKDVKDVFTDTFSKDVYERLGSERTDNDFSENLQYQQRTETLTDREILEMASNAIEVSTLSEAEKDALSIFQDRLSKLRDLQEQRTAQGKLYKEQQFGAKPHRAEAEKTLNRMHVLDSQIRKATADVLTVEEKEVLRRVLTKARKVVEANQRQHDREILDRWRDRRDKAAAIKKYRERIRADVEELSGWIIKPNNKDIVKHVPDVLKDSVIPFLKSINFTSKQALKGGEATKADKDFTKMLERLHATLINYTASYGVNYSDYIDLTPDFMEKMKHFVDSVKAITGKNTDDIIINQMTSEELKEFSQIIRSLKKLIRDFNRFHYNAMFRHVSEAGDDSIETLKALGSQTGSVSDFLFWQHMRPGYAMERFGEGGKSIFEGFKSGQAKFAFNTKEILRFTTEAYAVKEAKAWEQEIKEIKLGDDEVIKIPVSYIMSLYELAKDPEALTHIKGGGIRVATYKRNGKKISDTGKGGTIGHILSDEDLHRIFDLLTDRQKEVADKLQHYMAEQGGKWGNHVSVARFGEKLFINPHYYPIYVDGQVLSSKTEEFPESASLYALLNQSFTKSRKEGAKERIVVFSIFDVFSKHMSGMAQYNALALPVLDAVKWLNYQQVRIDDKGNRETVTTLREQMDRVYGAETEDGKVAKGYAFNFVENLIKSFNGTAARGTPYDSKEKKALHRYNRAQVAYNFRVVIQQPMAIIRAGLLIDPASILKGMKLKPAAIKKNIEEMQKHSGIAAWKSLGFYDVNISRGLTHLIKHDENLVDKIIDIGMWGAEKADTLTWAAIWSACKAEVIEKKELTPSSENFYEEVTKLFEDVVYKTQVVDSVLTKSEYMRDQGFVSRYFSSFMSEATTNASMVLDWIFKYNLDFQNAMPDKQAYNLENPSDKKAYQSKKVEAKKQSWKKHGKDFARMVCVYSVGAILLSAVQSVSDAFRDDDEYEEWGEKYWEAFLRNVIDELSPFNKLPIINQLWEVSKSILDAAVPVDLGIYGQISNLPWVDTAEQLTKGISIFFDKFFGNSTNYTFYAAAYKLLQATSGILGLPIASATREIVTFWNNTVGAMAPSLKIITYEATEAEQRNALYKAIISGDEKEIGRIEEKYSDQKEIDAAIRKALRENDPRIRKAAEAATEGNSSIYMECLNEILDEGHFERKIITGAIAAEIEKIKEDKKKQTK